jgi:hypothetical protein
MSARKPWFRCCPDELLSETAGMDSDAGYVFIILLLRIYANDGPVEDDTRALARRTGLSVKRVATALESLISAGKIIRLEDGK